MSVSGVKGTNVLFQKGKTTINEKCAAKPIGETKVDAKKALAIASAAAAAVGLGLIAVNKVRKGKVADLPKDFALGQANIKRLAHLKDLQTVNKQIADVAKRTSPEAVGAKMYDLAEAFGGAVEHVVQRASII